MRFQVIGNASGKYNVLDTHTDKLCYWTGTATNPPKYVGEDNTKAEFSEWNNYHCALGFTHKLEEENK